MTVVAAGSFYILLLRQILQPIGLAHVKVLRRVTSSLSLRLLAQIPVLFRVQGHVRHLTLVSLRSIRRRQPLAGRIVIGPPLASFLFLPLTFANQLLLLPLLFLLLLQFLTR